MSFWRCLKVEISFLTSISVWEAVAQKFERRDDYNELKEKMEHSAVYSVIYFTKLV